MADHLYLSVWLRGFTAHNMLQHLDRALRRFPYSHFNPSATLRVYAIEMMEPPAMERRFHEVASSREVIDAAREFSNADCAYQVEAFWDMWQFDGDWKLDAAPITLTLHGPEFASDLGEQLVADFGLDCLYLPGEAGVKNLTALRSNIRSLLRFTEELASVLPVEKRLLWSDSEENLADVIEEALAGQ
jgi:hypothetical protein